MEKQLLLPEVQEYLQDHLKLPVSQFALKKHPFNLSTNSMAQQLAGKQTAIKKFPDLAKNLSVLYPPKLNLEQTSSITTANYKASLVKGQSIVDLTGGFGIDSSAFAKAGKITTHIEKDELLQPYAVQLFNALSLKVDSFCGDGMSFLMEQDHFDTIYLDPARRNAAKSKVINLEEYEPNVLEHLSLLMSKCDQLLIKTSPMLDIQLGIKQLRFVSDIHVVAVNNEVKELLWNLDKTNTEVQIHCVNLESNDPDFSFLYNQAHNTILYSEVKQFLYEPNAAIMKSQGFDQLAQEHGLAKLARLSHLFTSDDLVQFPGRIYKVNEVLNYKPKFLKKHLNQKSRSVVTRNFPISSAQLKEMFKLGESEQYFSVFTTLASGRKICIECERINCL